MSRRPRRYVVWLGLGCSLVCSPIRAQSPSSPLRCFPPSVTNYDKAQLIGEKVFPKVVIDSVVFDGPTSLPASIRDQLVAELKEQSAHPAGTNWLEEWNDGAIRDAWMDEGFFKITSTSKVQIISSDVAEQHVAVIVHADEGIQYRLRDIRFGKESQIVPADADDGQTTGFVLPNKVEFHEFHDTEHLDADLLFPQEEWRKRFLLNDGAVLDASKIKEGLGALSRLYRSRGYIDFAATPETMTDDKSAMISLIIVLDEGKQFRVGEVLAYNLDLEKEAKLKSLIQPGDIYNSDPFGDFFRKNRLPFISVLQQNEDSGTIDLQFGYPTTCP